MVGKREVDHPPGAGGGEPRRIAILQSARSGERVRQPQPVADVAGVAGHASPSTRAALSFMMPGMTSSRKPTSAAAAIHLSGWISGKPLPNSILCLSWVLAYWITCLGKYFGLQ